MENSCKKKTTTTNIVSMEMKKQTREKSLAKQKTGLDFTKRYWNNM